MLVPTIFIHCCFFYGSSGAFLSSHGQVPQGRPGICSRQVLKSSPDILTRWLGAAGISPGGLFPCLDVPFPAEPTPETPTKVQAAGQDSLYPPQRVPVLL